jgi:hypothetical protein
VTAKRSATLVLENRHTGECLALRRVMRGDQVWLELKGSLPPRSEGPPLHTHRGGRGGTRHLRHPFRLGRREANHSGGRAARLAAAWVGASLVERRRRAAHIPRRFRALGGPGSISSGRVRNHERRSSRAATALLPGAPGLTAPSHPGSTVDTPTNSSCAVSRHCRNRDGAWPLQRQCLAGLSIPLPRGAQRCRSKWLISACRRAGRVGTGSCRVCRRLPEATRRSEHGA